MRKFRLELVFLALAAIALIASTTWTCLSKSTRTRRSGARGVASNTIEPYQRSHYRIAEREAVTWRPPIAQSSGGDWIYDLFTPPEIYYNRSAQRFTVSPPTTNLALASDNLPDAAAMTELRLCSVAPDLFRLQLVGFVQLSTETLGVFENRLTGETLVAGRGRTIIGLDLLIETIAVEHQFSSDHEDSLAKRKIATAVVADAKTGERIELTTSQPKYAATARAKIETEDLAVREVGTGDVIDVEGSRFQVIEIHLSPPRMMVARIDPSLGTAERFTLELQDDDVLVANTPST